MEVSSLEVQAGDVCLCVRKKKKSYQTIAYHCFLFHCFDVYGWTVFGKAQHNNKAL